MTAIADRTRHRGEIGDLASRDFAKRGQIALDSARDPIFAVPTPFHHDEPPICMAAMPVAAPSFASTQPRRT
jgi:hypothetical protein